MKKVNFIPQVKEYIHQKYILSHVREKETVRQRERQTHRQVINFFDFKL